MSLAFTKLYKQVTTASNSLYCEGLGNNSWTSMPFQQPCQNVPVASNFAIYRQSFAACFTLEIPTYLLADQGTLYLLFLLLCCLLRQIILTGLRTRDVERGSNTPSCFVLDKLQVVSSGCVGYPWIEGNSIHSTALCTSFSPFTFDSPSKVLSCCVLKFEKAVTCMLGIVLN